VAPITPPGHADSHEAASAVAKRFLGAD
jgi:hypothetical protein